MIPILYSPFTEDFDNNGEGLLTDAISCEVTEELNGVYEMVMTYPMSGQHYDKIFVDCLIKAKPNDLGDPQLFRIYSVTRPINQIVTINAEHISYELNKYPIISFFASGSAIVALNTLLNASVVPHKFTASSSVETVGKTSVPEPCSVRSCLGGKEGSILDVWGGEYEFDNYHIYLHKSRGQKTDVVLAYGKNLTDLSQEQNIGEMYTAVMPYVKKTENETEEYIYLPEKYIKADTANSFSTLKIAVVDFSQAFENETVTEQALREKAEEYIQSAGIGVPSVNITVSFAALWQSPEYSHLQLLERVNLGDTLTVRYQKLGVDAQAKVIKTVYDSLKERYVSLELGDAKSNLADTMNNLQWKAADNEKKISSVPALVNQKFEEASQLITGNKGGHIVMKLDADGKPQEFLIMDTEDIATAKKVWRWNLSGLGYSSNGFNGPFDKIAITMEGEINAQLLSAFEIIGAQITSGRIQSVDGSVYFDLDASVIKATEISSKDGSVKAIIGREDNANVFKIEMNGMTAFYFSGGYNDEYDSAYIYLPRSPLGNTRRIGYFGDKLEAYAEEGFSIGAAELEIAGFIDPATGKTIRLNADGIEIDGHIEANNVLNLRRGLTLNGSEAYTGQIIIQDNAGIKRTLNFNSGILTLVT